MSLRIYALLSNQGTATSETMLCEDEVRAFEPVALARDLAKMSGDTDPKGTFEDVTDNDEAACRWCGRDRDENTR
jgi:hypothetical protein